MDKQILLSGKLYLIAPQIYLLKTEVFILKSLDSQKKKKKLLGTL